MSSVRLVLSYTNQMAVLGISRLRGIYFPKSPGNGGGKFYYFFKKNGNSWGRSIIFGKERVRVKIYFGKKHRVTQGKNLFLENNKSLRGKSMIMS